MTNLYKKEFKNYDTYFYENFNILNQEDVFGDSLKHWVPINPDRNYVGNFTEKTDSNAIVKGEETYVENYSNLLTTCVFNKTLVVVEENEDKISLKCFTYRNHRAVGKRYFKTRKTVSFLTFNLKRKLFYMGESNFKKKQNINFKCRINTPTLYGSSILQNINYEFKNETEDIFNIFLDRVIDRTGVNVGKNQTVKSKYFEMILNFSKIKYPNAFFKFSEMYAPTKEVRKYDSNLVTWFMKKNNLKGKKIKLLLNKYDNIDTNNIIDMYRFFGQDLFNRINDEVFFTDETHFMNRSISEVMSYSFSLLTKKEKENMISVLNETTSSHFVPLLNDHLRFKNRLQKYGEDVKFNAKNLKEFNQEHTDWSVLVESYSNGHITRSYGENSYLVEEPLYINSDTYYPTLFKTTEDYQGESAHQHNCVRTYSEKSHCFIVSLRKNDKNGDDRATIEYQFTQKGLRRTQTLGKYNMVLTDEWVEPIDELDKRLDYYYKEGLIKLPEMIKKYKNGKIHIMKAIFNNYDETNPTYDIYPKWVNEKEQEVFSLASDYPYDELFLDLP